MGQLKLLRSLIRRKRATDKVMKNLDILRENGDSVLFISRNIVDELGCVVFYLAGDFDKEESDAEAYLQLRQLLKKLKEQVEEKGDFKLDIKLTKGKRKK